MTHVRVIYILTMHHVSQVELCSVNRKLSSGLQKINLVSFQNDVHFRIRGFLNLYPCNVTIQHAFYFEIILLEVEVPR